MTERDPLGEFPTDPPLVRAACWVVHNVIAHPLLVLCPPLGRFIHDATAPEPDPR